VFDGLPVGCCAVPIPKYGDSSSERRRRNITTLEETKRNEERIVTKNNSDRATGISSLQWSLNNTYPVPGQAILRHNVAKRSHCRPFETVQLRHLPQYQCDDDDVEEEEECRLLGRKTCTTASTAVSIGHPRPHVMMQNDPSIVSVPLKLPSSYVLESQTSIRRNARRENEDATTTTTSTYELLDTDTASSNISSNWIYSPTTVTNNNNYKPQTDISGANLNRLKELWGSQDIAKKEDEILI